MATIEIKHSSNFPPATLTNEQDVTSVILYDTKTREERPVAPSDCYVTKDGTEWLESRDAWGNVTGKLKWEFVAIPAGLWRPGWRLEVNGARVAYHVGHNEPIRTPGWDVFHACPLEA